jgi:Ca2+-binding RTX toxin-like protein
MPSAPTASGRTLSRSAGESTPLSQLFTYADVDNDIVRFAVRDREVGGGYLTRNGVRQAENTLFDSIPINEIGLWAFVAGPAGSSSTIGFNAIDSRGTFNPSAVATVNVAAPSDPVASGTTVSRSAGQSTPLSQLFSYSDADGDITRFSVRDREVGGGYLTRNGVRQTENALFDNIPIGEIGLWAFVAGPAGSSSTIGFNAIDSRGAFNPSAVSTVNVAAAVAHDPIASGTTVTRSAGQSTPLSQLFTYSDADGDITRFSVRDREVGGGYLTRNGVRQTENALFDNIPIGEIGLWAFVAGPAGSTSTIGFNAIDARGAFNPSAVSTVNVQAAASNDPIASGATVSRTAGQSTPLTQLFTYSDADNDIVSFAVRDREVGGGYLTRNGVRQTENALFENVPIAEIGLWAFVAGPAGSSSTIGFNAIDSRGAFNPSAVATVSVAAAAASDPIASGATVSRSAGQSTPLSQLFTYSDADNDIVSFAVRDREVGGGYLTRNGVRQTENALFDNIPISEIGLWAFVAGPAGSISTIGFNAIDSRGAFNASVTATVSVAGAATQDDYADQLGDNISVGTLTTSASGFIGPADGDDTAGDKDVFSVSLTQGQSYVFRLDGASVAGHAALSTGIFTIRSGSNFANPLATSSEGGSAVLEFEAPSTGTFYVRVGAGGANFTTLQGGYSLSVQTVAAPADDPGNTRETAWNITSDLADGAFSYSGRAGGGDPADFFKFIAPSTGTLTLTLNGLSADLDLKLMNANGDTLVSSTNGSSNAEALTLAVTAGQTIFIDVFPYGTAQSNYALNVGFQVSAPAPQTPTLDSAATLIGGPLFMVLAQFAVAAYHGGPNSLDATSVWNALDARGWSMLTAADLGGWSPPPGMSISDGVVSNQNAAVLLARASDALVISFRGTNEGADMAQWASMDRYLELFQPIIDEINDLIRTDATIKKVYVTGHSLGAAMVDVFMHVHQDFPRPNGQYVTFEAATFAHPDLQVAGWVPLLAGSAAGAGIRGLISGWGRALNGFVDTGFEIAEAGAPVWGRDARVTSFHNDMDPIRLADFEDAGLTPGRANIFAYTGGTRLAHDYQLYLYAMEQLTAAGVTDSMFRSQLRVGDENYFLLPEANMGAANSLEGRSNGYVLVGGHGNDTYRVHTSSLLQGDAIVDAGSTAGGDTLQLLGALGLEFTGQVRLTASGNDLRVIPYVSTSFGSADLAPITIRGHFTAAGRVENIRYNGQTVQLPTSSAELANWGGAVFRAVSPFNAVISEGVDGARTAAIAALGGAGALDTISVFGLKTPFIANLATGVASILDGLGFGQNIAVDVSGMENVVGGDDVDNITGNNAANRVETGAGDDRVDGGGGDDSIVGGSGPGNDTYIGGSGVDTVIYSSASQSVIVNLATGVASGVDIDTDSLTGIENVIAGSGNDRVVGGGGVNMLFGGPGNDNLYSYLEDFEASTVVNDGANVLEGGEGNDVLRGSGGAETLLGGDGDDTIGGRGGADVLDGGAGSDRAIITRIHLATGYTLDFSLAGGDFMGPEGERFISLESLQFVGGTGGEAVTGGAGADLIDGREGNDTLNGGGGADIVIGDLGDDLLNGGAGDDEIYAGDGLDAVDGGDGADRAVLLFGDRAAALTFALGAGGAMSQALIGGVAAGSVVNVESVEVHGTSFNDTLTGGAGDDALYGWLGVNTLNGGAGHDLGSVGLGDRVGDVVFVMLPGGATTTIRIGGVVASVLIGIEAVELYTGQYEDVLFGGAFNDRFFTGGQNDWAYGGDGSDTLFGESGVDVLQGQAGDDTINGGSEADYLYGGAGADLIEGEGGNDHLFGDADNDTISGGDGSDELLGDLGADALNGDAGDDYLYGEGDGDVLTGGVGNDRMYGGAGNDILGGGDGVDVLVGGEGGDGLNGDGGNDYIYAGLGDDAIDGGGEDDVLLGEAGDDTIAGGAGDDAIYAADGADLISGDGGADYVFAGIGNDIVSGGAGNDVLLGEGGLDSLTGEDGSDYLFGGDDTDALNGGLGDDRLYGDAGDDALEGGAGADLLLGDIGGDVLHGGDDNDYIYGENGVDFLFGDAGADSIFGGNDGDRIDGGAGNDLLRGGLGGDVFVKTANSGDDVVGDFQDGLDLMDLRGYSGATFANTTVTSVGADTLITFAGGGSLHLVGVNAASISAADFLFL